jgi:hypothetical protein
MLIAVRIILIPRIQLKQKSFTGMAESYQIPDPMSGFLPIPNSDPMLESDPTPETYAMGWARERAQMYRVAEEEQAALRGTPLRGTRLSAQSGSAIGRRQ